jgi:uncharacterized membrane protein YbhN (UPF0104 family)
LRVLVSCALLALLVWKTPVAQIAGVLKGMTPAALLAACALSLGGWWLSGLRLWCLLPEFPPSVIVRATFVALFHSTVLPGQLAGDAIKAWRLRRQCGRPGHAEAATLVDRGLAVLAMFAIGAAASASGSFPPALRWFFVVGTAAIAAGGALVAAPPFRRVLEGRGWRDSGRIGRFLGQFALAMHDCLRRPSRMLASFALALVFHACSIASHVVLGNALHLPLAWGDWAGVYAGASLIALVPVSIAGLGVREGGYVALLALFGLGAAAGLAMSALVFGLMLAGAAVGAAIEFSRPGLRHAPQEGAAP